MHGTTITGTPGVVAPSEAMPLLSPYESALSAVNGNPGSALSFERKKLGRSFWRVKPDHI